jgi:hypothetical protein
VRRGLWCALLAVVITILAGCGGGSEKKEETEQPSVAAKAACSGAALADTSKLQLPPSWPQIEADKMTYTKQEKSGPTVVIEGYFNGDVKEAHDEWKKELEASGYKILFDELEDHDSEVSWEGEGRTGQVALREECGSPDKIWVHITNRPE